MIALLLLKGVKSDILFISPHGGYEERELI